MIPIQFVINDIIAINIPVTLSGGGSDAVVNAAWLESRTSLVRTALWASGIQVTKKQNVSSPLTCADSILWGASVAGG